MQRLGDIPENWRVQRADRVLSVLKRTVLPSEISGQQVVHYSIPNVQEWGRGTIEPGESIDSVKTLVDRTLLLVSKLNPRKGTIAVAEPDSVLTTVASSEFVALEPEHCEAQFAQYLYRSEHVRSELSSRVDSATNSHQRCSPDDITKLVVPWPPLSEQVCISHYLDHVDRRIRRYIRAKQRLIALLEEQKQVIIYQAVTGQIDVRTGEPYSVYKPSGVEWLGDVPDRWEVVPLRRVTLGCCDGPFGSGLKSSHYTEKGVRVIRLQNIGHGEFKDSDATFISPEHYSSLGDHSVVSGDVIIAGLGDKNHPSGRACVAPAGISPAMVKADCFRFRLNQDQIQPRFAALQLTATASVASAVLSTGATRQRTNLQSTSGRAIGIPSVSEQHSIVEYLTAAVSGIRRARVAVQQEIDLLREYRTRLIADIVTGKLDVRAAAAQLSDHDAYNDTEETSEEQTIDQEIIV